MAPPSQSLSSHLVGLIERLTDGVLVFDASWRFLYVNAVGERVLGKGRDALLGKELWTEFPELEGTVFGKAYRRGMSERVEVSVEDYYAPFSNWFEARALPTDDGGLMLLFRNVTERRNQVARSQQALLDSRERLRLAQESANLGDWTYDPATDGVTLSDRAAEIFGVPVGEALSWARLREALHPEDRERAARAVEASLKNRNDYAIEYRVPRPGQKPRWVAAYGHGTYDPNGRVTGMLGVVRDITARHEEEERREEEARRTLEAEQQRLRQHVEQAPVAIAILRGPRLEYELANASYGRLVGRDPAKMLGRSFAEVFPEIPPEAPILQLLHSVWNTGEPFIASEYSIPMIRGDQGRVDDAYFHFHLEPMRESSGELTGMFCVAQDVTNQVLQRRAVEALVEERGRLLESEKSARRNAEEANQLKDEFLATVSHELRTPLSAMLGWVHILKGTQVTPERRERAIATIQRNAQAQAQLIEDLLDVSRIMSGKLRLEVKPVNVASIVELALETVRPAADAKGIRLLPTLDTGGTVMGDPDRLQQVIWNLLSNAVKFTPRGGTVQVLATRSDSSVEVTVADTGEGIPADFIPYLFERFRQADATTSRKQGGLGLGLSIVKHLVELHGGTVEAASDGPGLGATLKVRLPVAIATRVPAEVLDRPRAISAGEAPCPPELDGLKILVVDDEDDGREFLRTLLQDCKAEVVTAGSAAEGMARLISVRPDILVSDVGMPGEDGYSFIRRVRALSPDQGGRTPAIALTAYARTDDRTRALLAGFHSHVAKPVEPIELLAVIAALATHRRTSG